MIKRLTSRSKVNPIKNPEMILIKDAFICLPAVSSNTSLVANDSSIAIVASCNSGLYFDGLLTRRPLFIPAIYKY